MKIPGRGSPEFWRLYHQLPADTRALARKNYQLWRENAFRPSLHFKPIGPANWSARVGAHHRAIGRFIDQEFLCEWIGTHSEYDKRFYNPKRRHSSLGYLSPVAFEKQTTKTDIKAA